MSAIGGIVQQHSESGTVLVAGHSYGSVPAAWMCLEMPQSVANLILLDPVSVLLALPTVVRSFLYNAGSNWMGNLIQLGAASEVGIAYTLRRHFHWYNQCLFASDLGRVGRTLLVLAENDVIVPTSQVREHLESSKVSADVVWLPDFHHAQLLFSSSVRAKIENWLCEQDETAVPDRVERDSLPLQAVTAAPLAHKEFCSEAFTVATPCHAAPRIARCFRSSQTTTPRSASWCNGLLLVGFLYCFSILPQCASHRESLLWQPELHFEQQFSL